MYGDLPGGQIILASDLQPVGGAGEDNEVFITTFGDSEQGDGTLPRSDGSETQVI